MRKKGIWLLSPLLSLLLAFSVAGPVLAQEGPPPAPHSFYGTVTIAGLPAPADTIVEARGAGVLTGVDYNPITTTVEGQYGSHPLGPWLVVQGYIDEGTPIEFYVNGARAQLYDVEAQVSSDTYPFHSQTFTELNLTVPDTTPPTVGIDIPEYINIANVGAVAVSITSDEAGTYSFTIDDTDAAIAAITGTGAILAGETITLSLDLSTLADGPITADASVEDAAGNVGNAPQATAAKDTIEPTVTIDAVTTPTNVATQTLTGTMEGGSTVVLTADTAATFGAVSYPTATTWTAEVTLVEGPNVITATATDVAENTGTAEATIVLEFVVVPPYFTTTLPAGWNLLSTPIKLGADSDAVEQIFDAPSLANIEVSYRWDGVSQLWVGVTSGYELLPLEAIYLKVSSGASATAEFIPSQELSGLPSRELEPGLNLIGPAPALEAGVFPAMPLDQALISIAEAPGGLTGYTIVVSPPHNQPGWSYALGGQIQDLLSCKGYWVVMENADTLYGFSTTPISP